MWHNSEMARSNSSSSPRVSIVTPSYNQGWCIERTILSVLRQDYDNIEYVVMDSASTDETRHILAKYSNEIDIICQEKDKGQSDALNRGFKKTTGSILAYLNSDDCYASRTVVSDAVKVLTSEPGIDLVYGRRYFIDKNGFYTRAYPYREYDRELLKKSCYVPQECTFWTREIYERSGDRVDDSLRFAMDYELWLRFLQHGAKFKSIDSVYGLFRWHEDQKSQDLWKTVALPEIASLQSRYCSRVMQEQEMQNEAELHDFGVNIHSEKWAFNLSIELWKRRNAFKQNAFADTPLDQWPLNTIYAVCRER